MARCDYFGVCNFLEKRLQNMPQIAGLYRMQFCESDCGSCARHMVMSALGPGAAPDDLYPNQQERVDMIVSGLGKAA